MVFEGADVLGRFHRLHLSVLDRHDQICDQLIHKPESPGDPEPTVDLMFQVGGKHFLSRIIGQIVDPIGELRTSNPNRVLMKPDRQIAGLAFEGQGSQMGLVEAWGSGIKRILNAAEEHGLPKPRFQEFDNMFRVELFRTNQVADQANQVTDQANPNPKN